jgi:peroxiredoxin
VIDKQGKLRHVLYGVHAHKHPDEVLNLIKEMK